MFGSCPGEEDYPDVCKVEEGPRREGSRAERRREGYRSRTQEESVETGPRREGCRSRTQEGFQEEPQQPNPIELHYGSLL